MDGTSLCSLIPPPHTLNWSVMQRSACQRVEVDKNIFDNGWSQRSSCQRVDVEIFYKGWTQRIACQRIPRTCTKKCLKVRQALGTWQLCNEVFLTSSPYPVTLEFIELVPAKKCLKVRQALGTRKLWKLENLKTWKPENFENIKNDPWDMLNNFCFHVLAQKSQFIGKIGKKCGK